MSETTPQSTETGPVHKSTKGRLLATLTLIGAGVAGIAAFVENIDKLGTEAAKICQYVRLCAAEPLPPLTLPVHTTDWMGGGHNPGEQCNPWRDKYRSENPKYVVSMKTSEEHRKDLFGKVEYKYTCVFSTVPK